MPRITNANELNLVNAETNYTKGGFKFTTKIKLKVEYITKHASCTATIAYILDASQNVLFTATFVGDVATFTEANLTTLTTYYMAVDNGGTDYVRKLNYTDQSYPIDKETIIYTGALDNISDSLKAFNIISITTLNNIQETSTGILNLGKGPLFRKRISI